jgi:hypothetical protein
MASPLRCEDKEQQQKSGALKMDAPRKEHDCAHLSAVVSNRNSCNERKV